MDDTLIFLHLLAAAMLFVTTVIFSAYALGASVDKPTLSVARVTWGVGGLAVLVFGVWMALRLDRYEITDAWILIAIALWMLATEAGRRAELGGIEAVGSGAALASQAVTMHWVRTALVVLLLADMIWKPWA